MCPPIHRFFGAVVLLVLVCQLTAATLRDAVGDGFFPENPVGDATFPDLRGVEARVEEGNFLLWLTFTHGVGFQDLRGRPGVMVVEVGIDLDYRLWTGYANTGEVPPTLGLDRKVKLTLSGLSPEPGGRLEMRRADDPTTPADGLTNDLVGLGLGT